MSAIPYNKVSAVIRFASILCAQKLTDIGQKNERQFNCLLEEFLAFFSTVACNEICVRLGSRDQDAVIKCYESIRSAFADEQPNSDLEPIKVPAEIKIFVSALISEPSYKNCFWAYWNGDLNSLRISQSDIEKLAKMGLEKPSHGEISAAYAILVRACRYQNPAGVLPPIIVFAAYDKIIRQEMENFVQALRTVIA